MSTIGKSIEADSGLVVARGYGEWGMESDCLRIWGFIWD